MLTVTKSFEFDYAHKLPNYKGKCENLHGHRGKLSITLNGCPNKKKKDGMVIDFSDVKSIVQPLIDKLDHAYLNDFIDNPTAENMIKFVLDELQKTELAYHIVKIRIYETPDSYAEYLLK